MTDFNTGVAPENALEQQQPSLQPVSEARMGQFLFPFSFDGAGAALRCGADGEMSV